MKRFLVDVKITALMAALITASSASFLQAAEPETVTISAQDLTLEVPKAWKQQQPSSRMRLAQFAIAPVEGELDPTELAVFPPFGGSVSENVKRWIDQFQPSGRTVKMTQGTFSDGKYVLVDLAGTYNKPDGPPVMGKTKPTPEYKMLAAMLITEKGNYFLKLTGPAKTVDATAAAFRKSFGGDATKEEAYSF